MYTSKTNSKSVHAEAHALQPQSPPPGRHTPHAPTQLRLARSLARMTRTRNKTETDFPVGGATRAGLTPQTSDIYIYI